MNEMLTNGSSDDMTKSKRAFPAQVAEVLLEPLKRQSHYTAQLHSSDALLTNHA